MSGRSTCTARWPNVARSMKSFGVRLGALKSATGAKREELQGEIVLAPPSAIADRWSRRLPDPVTAFASGWMRVRARARQQGVELPLVISDHADWGELTATIAETGAEEIWVTHGREDALLHHIQTHRAARAARWRWSAARTRTSESLRRTARPAGLYAVAQRQAPPAGRLFRLDAGPRSRLGARRAHRRAVLPAAAAPHPERDARGRASIRCCSACRATMSAIPPRPSR